MSYVMFPPLFLLSVLRQYKMLTDSSKEFECKFEELRLEKEHLLAYLRQTGTGNHNHLVKVHIHGIPGQPHPLVPATEENNILPQSTTCGLTAGAGPALKGITTETQTKPKKNRKRKGKSAGNKGKVANMPSSLPKTNGVTETNANSFFKSESNFSAEGVSEIAQQFEMLSPVGMFETKFIFLKLNYNLNIKMNLPIL